LILKRDTLLEIERAEQSISQKAAHGIYDPRRFDVNLFFNKRMFNEVLANFDGLTFTPDPKKPIDVTIESVRFDFRPGYPSVIISASATHREYDVRAKLLMNASALIEVKGGKIVTRLVATKIVPELRWGALELHKLIFVRQLAQIKIHRFLENLPPVSVPASTAIAIGGPPSRKTISVPVRDGRISGVLSVPGTDYASNIVVVEVLALRNGIHIYANVVDKSNEQEGIASSACSTC
jgi:hypothetical protein